MLNKWTGQGRFVKAPELRQVGEENAVAVFTLACDRNYKTKDGERPADFIDCEAWDGRGESIVNNFNKGDMIVVSGSIKTRLYDDKSGNKRKSVVVDVTEWNFCQTRKNDAQDAQGDAGNGFSDVDPNETPF